MIGITPTDVEKPFINKSYSVGVDEDNTAFEFKVYGDDYIVFLMRFQKIFTHTHIMVLTTI